MDGEGEKGACMSSHSQTISDKLLCLRNTGSQKDCRNYEDKEPKERKYTKNRKHGGMIAEAGCFTLSTGMG
ncbi:hypothetical protein SUGI_0599810 [Cryptomeria japonica]|nr:hypothetical protein SUGI_0599810 [Cryptomeria japonica]